MRHAELDSALARLREELEALGPEAGAARSALGSLITEIERDLQALEHAEHAASLGQRIQHQVERFEVEHPRVTGILNEIMISLANLGI